MMTFDEQHMVGEGVHRIQLTYSILLGASGGLRLSA